MSNHWQLLLKIFVSGGPINVFKEIGHRSSSTHPHWFVNRQLLHGGVFQDAETTENVTLKCRTSKPERSMDCLFSEHDTRSKLFCRM